MKHMTTIKRIALASLLLLLLLGISGCLSKPDTLEDLPDDTGQVVLPFATATPTPTPPPVDPNGGIQPGDGTGEATAVPTAAVQLITASPSAVPVWTYSASAATASPKPTDNGTLREGSTGQAVKNMQQRLKDLGYYTGSVDGTFGSGTKSALEAFQRANGLTTDGVAGSRTLSALNSSNAKSKPKNTSTKAPTSGSKYATSRPAMRSYTPSTLSTYRYLQMGSSGADVTRLQNRLKELGYFNGTVNGNFGQDTEAALLAFQKRNGLWVDGVAGEDTQRELFSSSALPNNSGSSINTQNNNSVPLAGYRTLANGESGEDVKALQNRLKELGYYTGTVDGKFGATTATAVQSFQAINGLTADGVAGTGTLARMYGENALYAPTTEIVSLPKTVATLELGSVGEEVYRLQERLYELGYYTGQIDGIYSQAVADAVKAFQRASKLTADGKAGRGTQTKLYGESAVRAASSEESAYATLRQGDSGERVRALQSLLSTYGYFTETVHGSYDVVTMMAVQAFQAQNGLTADGVAGPATQQLLYQGTPKHASTETLPQQTMTFATLKQGADSPDVTMLQQFLQELGYLHDDADGVYGASTLIAVQAFQASNGLNADGIAGHETLALLYSGDGVPAPGYGQVATQQTPDRTTMKQGDEGQDVFTMQERLRTLGYLAGEPDGQYGSGTTDAVRAFQTRNNLKADGVAGPETVTAMYAANAIATGSAAVDQGKIATVSNRDRELEEQSATGAIQGSLSGGGIAAAYSGNTYYAGRGGTLYRISESGDKQVFDGPASFIHASSKGVTFVSGNKILRVPTGGGNAQTLASGKNIKKMMVIADTLYYLDGDALIKAYTQGDPQTLATGVNDFAIDIYQHEAYLATAAGVTRMGLNGSGEERLVSTKADQVMIGENVLFFRSGGNIYRIENGISVLIVSTDASWAGIYREHIYYISGGKLYRCDTAGLNSGVFYDGNVASVSFVSGRAYITEKKGGEVTQILPTE